MHSLLQQFDRQLINKKPQPELIGTRRLATEFLYFGLKELRACLFVGLFFAAVLTVPRAGFPGVSRYDALLIIAIAIQAWMVITGLETLDELKAISLFHLIGLGLEIFKTSDSIRSWSYPEVWQYPNQAEAWAVVHVGKWTSWSLLVIMTFTIVAHLKHIKETVYVPE